MSLKDGEWPSVNIQPPSLPEEPTGNNKILTEYHSLGSSVQEYSSIPVQPQQLSQIQPEVTRPTSGTRVHSQPQGRIPSIIIPRYRLGIDSLIRQNIPRRAQITSQGTVVINHAARAARYKKSGHQTNTATVDGQKRQAEGDYYEQRDRLGDIRRGSMLRTVSKEDYLLGRGANPRTGVITPGSRSIDSNVDSGELPLIETVALPAKWKQRGDQWVSLDIDQPTPHKISSDVPSVPILPVSRPQFLQSANEHKQRRGSESSNDQQYRRDAMLNGTANFESQYLPGSYPERPAKPSITSQPQPQLQPKPAASAVRRKPVGASSSKSASGTQAPLLTERQESTPYKLGHRSREGNRSLSVPNLPKQILSPAYFTEDSSQNLEPGILSGPPAVHNTQGSRSFLGARSQTLTGLHQLYKINQLDQEPNLDKELPCLPMSSGPYQQLPSNQALAPVTKPRQKKHLEVVSTAPPQPIQTLERAKSTSRRSHIADMAISSPQISPRKRSDAMAKESIYEVPKYDNPPRSLKPRPARQQVLGPRAMPQPSNMKPRALGLNEASLDPFNTTSMNTDTFMYAPNNRRLRPQPRFRYPPMARPPPLVPLPAIPAPKHNRRNAVVMDSIDVDIAVGRDALPPILPKRSAQRPQMASRADALLHIPKTQTTQGGVNMMHMEPHNLSSTTGMLTPGNLKGDVSCIRQTINPLMKGDQFNVIQRSRGETATVNITETLTPHPMRRCSRCENGMVKEMQSSIGGLMVAESHRKRSIDSTHAPEVVDLMGLPTPIPEVAGPRSSQDSSNSHSRSATSATILNVEDDLRDHSICCPDCCRLDCHEGCLGHPTPLSSPTRFSIQNEQSDLCRLDSCTTLVSSSGESSASEDKEDRRHKLSFLRHALKLTFWPKTISNDSQSSSSSATQKRDSHHDRKSTTAQATPSRMINGTPGRESAIAAAKRAITSKSFQCSAEHGLNQLMIPKKRSADKKPNTVAITEGKPATGVSSLSTLPIPKVSATANERRKITGSRPCSENQSNVLHPPSEVRTVSAGSIDVRLPVISGVDLGNLSEFLFIVPFEAIRMWLRNNPQVMDFGWSALDCGQMMYFATLATTKVLLNTMYIYSKTGRLRIKDTHGNKIGVQELVIDSLKSVLYVLILLGLAVAVWRIVRFFLFPIRLLLLAGRYLVLGDETAGQ